jgi:molybdate transport system substrate-binding protein
MMEHLYIRSSGAAYGLIGTLSNGFSASRQIELSSEFAAVGTTFERVRDALLTDQRCDLAVLTPALAQRLIGEFPDRVTPGGSLGITATCLACVGDAKAFDISTVDALRKTFSSLDVIYTGDTRHSTVGRHLMQVLERLDLADGLGPEVVDFPGGALAVAALRDTDKRALACAQLTEIRQHADATSVGPLPGKFHLASEYVLAIIDKAPAATHFAAMLTDASQVETRRRSGFEPA